MDAEYRVFSTKDLSASFTIPHRFQRFFSSIESRLDVSRLECRVRSVPAADTDCISPVDSLSYRDLVGDFLQSVANQRQVFFID